MDLAASRLIWGGEVPVMVVVGDGVRRARWPRGVDVLRVRGVPPGGLAAGRQLVELARGLGEDVVFCGVDTLLLDWLRVADAFDGADVWTVEYGGFCEPGHWLWGVGAAAAGRLAGWLGEVAGGVLGGVVSGAAGADDVAGLGAAAVVYRLAAARGVRCGQFAAGDAGVHVFRRGDLRGGGVPGDAWCVHCGCPGFVRGYPRAEVAVRRAMLEVLRGLE